MRETLQSKIARSDCMRVSECVRACVRACVCVRVRACVCARASVCACVCVWQLGVRLWALVACCNRLALAAVSIVRQTGAY